MVLCSNRRLVRILFGASAILLFTYFLFWEVHYLKSKSDGIKKYFTIEPFVDVPGISSFTKDWISYHQDKFPRVRSVNCKLLETDDADGKAEIQRAKHIPAKEKEPKLTAEYFSDMKNCEAFKRNHGYITSSLLNEEGEFPIAYSILFYKDLNQVERLLRAIYRPQNYYCLHIDIKARAVAKDAARAIANCFDNVFLASKMVDVQWATYTVLEPELVCMEDLWKYKSWKYFINLTGQEFPLKTNYEIVQILKAYNGTNDITGVIPQLWKDIGRHQLVFKKFTSFETMQKLRSIQRNLHFTYTKGSVHITASRGYVDYVLHNETALNFREWVKYTSVPDETFFSTLNNNPQLNVPGGRRGKPLKEKLPKMTRFKEWLMVNDGPPPKNSSCAGKVVRNLCIFGVGDINRLVSRPELFVNKFNSEFQRIGYDCLEEWHFRKIIKEYTNGSNFDVSYYVKLRDLWNQA